MITAISVLSYSLQDRATVLSAWAVPETKVIGGA